MSDETKPKPGTRTEVALTAYYDLIVEMAGLAEQRMARGTAAVVESCHTFDLGKDLYHMTRMAVVMGWFRTVQAALFRRTVEGTLLDAYIVSDEEYRVALRHHRTDALGETGEEQCRTETEGAQK